MATDLPVECGLTPRVLLFSTLYPSSVRPGHGVFVENRLRELAATGQADVRVVAPVPWFWSADARFGEWGSMARTPRRERWNGIDVCHPRYPLPPKVGMNIAPLLLAAGAAPALRRLRREGFDFDVIDAHYYYPDGVAAALLARWFDRPLVITARGSDINLIARHALPRRWMRWAAGRADTSIAVSAALASAMKEAGISDRPVDVLRNGVDLTRFRPHPRDEARALLGWPAGPTMLVVGNLLESKGQHLAIRALPLLPQFRLCLVGEGRCAGSLRELAAELGVSDRVQFCGRIEQDRLPVYYSAADMLVLASEREGLPNVVLEALACGTPVVASAVGGIPEVLEVPRCGRLLAQRTAQAVADAVLEVAAQRIDAAAVRAAVDGSGWGPTTQAQLAIFRRLAARQGARGHDRPAGRAPGLAP